MTFIRVEWLLLLPMAWVIVWFWYRALQSDGWQALLPKHLAAKLLTGAPTTARWWHLASAVLALSLLIIGLAGPSFSERSVPAQQAKAVRVVILSLHQSMATTDVAPSRMQQAHFMVKDLLQQWAGSQVALVAYSRNAALMSPPTPDFQLIDTMLPLLTSDIPSRHGDNLIGALEQAQQVFERAGVQRGQVVVVADHLPRSALDAAASWQPTIDITLDVLYVGTAAGERPVTVNHWQALANEFGGAARDRSGIAVVAERNMVDDAITLEQDFLVRHDSGIWFVVAALLPLIFLIGQRQLLVTLPFACLLVAPQPVQAGWFDNREQQAQALIAQGDYEQALALTEDPMTKAMALYQSGDYQAAIDAWRQQSGIDSVFNQGVAYAQLQNFDAAKAAFEAILAVDPEHTQAAENLAALEQRQQQSDQQNDQQDQQQGEQESEQPASDESDGQSGDGDRQPQAPDSNPPPANSEQDNDDATAMPDGLPDDLLDDMPAASLPPMPSVQGSGEDIDSARMMSLEPQDPARLLRFRFNQSRGEN